MDSIDQRTISRYEFPIADLKAILQALITTRTASHLRIAEDIEFDENAVKQFLHRNSRNPRKTPLYHALNAYVGGLSEATIEKLCKSQPSLQHVFWNCQLRHPFDYGTVMAPAAIDEAISRAFQNLEIEQGPLFPQYFVLKCVEKPDDGNEVTKRIEKTSVSLKYRAGRIEYLEEGVLGASDAPDSAKFRRGMAVLGRSSLCLVAESTQFDQPDICWFKLPQIGQYLSEDSRICTVEPFVDHFDKPDLRKSVQSNKFNFGKGLRLRADANEVPVSEKAVLLCAPLVDRKQLGPQPMESLSAREMLYVRHAWPTWI